MSTRSTKIREVMTSPVITIRPEATFPDIVDTLLHNDVSGLPVVDAANQLLGIVTEADLISNEAYGFKHRRPLALLGGYLRGHDPQWLRKASGKTALELMTRQPMTAKPDETIASAAQRMLTTQRKRLPVVDGDALVGIVTRRDLLTLFHRSDDDMQHELDDVFANSTHMYEPLAHPHVAGGVVTLTGQVEFAGDVEVLGALAERVVGVVAVDNQLTSRRH